MNALDGQKGIFLRKANNTAITNCHFYDCDWGIFIESAEKNTIFNCEFGRTNYGVHFRGNDYGNLTECYFTDNDIAIQIEYGIDYLVADNIIDSNNWGIKSYIGENCQVLNNSISNIAEDGIYIMSASDLYPSSILVADNEIAEIGKVGINIEMKGCTIANNTITRTGSMGIEVSKTESIIFNNTITDIDYYGMYVAAPNSEITNNTISYTARYGIMFGSTYSTTVYQNNSLYGCGFAFISAYEGFVFNETNTVDDKPVAYYFDNESVVISSTDMYGQIILDNCSGAVLNAVGVSGITVKNSPSISITNCDVSGLTYGIEVDNCSNSVIDTCSVSSTHFEGIILAGSHYSTIQNSVVSNSPFRGLSVYDSSFVNISDCTIQNSGDLGIRIYVSNDLTISNCEIINSGTDGISLSGSNFVSISSTIIDTTASMGIFGWDNCLDLEIEDCILRNNPYSGINLRLSDFNLINNTIENSGDYGIIIDNDFIPDPHHVYIANNTIRGAKKGINLMYVSEISGTIEILGNLIEDCDWGIEEMSCNFITADYNTFNNCEFGIRFGVMQDIFIRHNIFTFCGTGIEVSDITNIDISHNFINTTSIGINYFEISGTIQYNTIYYYDECITGYSTLALVESDNTCMKVQPPETPTGTDPTGGGDNGFKISGFSSSSLLFFAILSVMSLMGIFKKKRKQ
jgi:parallel beta-helix repeat protein